MPGERPSRCAKSPLRVRIWTRGLRPTACLPPGAETDPTAPIPSLVGGNQRIAEIAPKSVESNRHELGLNLAEPCQDLVEPSQVCPKQARTSSKARLVEIKAGRIEPKRGRIGANLLCHKGGGRSSGRPPTRNERGGRQDATWLLWPPLLTTRSVALLGLPRINFVESRDRAMKTVPHLVWIRAKNGCF